MYILKNAIKNISRNWGRNILLSSILFVIILTTATSIIINNTVTSLADEYKSQFGAEVVIYYDFEKMDNNTVTRPLTTQEYVAFGESDFLQKKVFVGSHSLMMTNIKGVGDGDMSGVGQDTQGSGTGKPMRPNALLMGYSDENINDEFEKGTRELIEGKKADSKGEVIISQALAQLNDIQVGATITIEKNGGRISDTLIVSGIYRDNLPVQDTFSAMTNRSNELITTLEIFDALAVNAIDETSANTVFLQAKYFLKNPELLEEFQAELHAKGLPEYYKVTVDEANYNRISEPVDSMKKITTTFMIVVLLLGSVVLIILSTMSIRERKYEVGVLRAMGLKKSKVARGLVYEMLIITATCLVLGLSVGSFAAKPIATILLSDQIAVSERQHGVEQGVSETTIPFEMEIQMTSETIMQISFISLFLAGISSLVGIIFITKYEPMRILSERD